MKPLVVKLAMIVMLTLNTRRQRENTRMLRAPRMRREPTDRRGFELFAISLNRSQQRAAQRDSSSDATARQKVRPAPRHGRPTSCSVGEARAKYISKRATCAKEAREPRTSSYCSECASVARLLLKRVVDDLADTTSEAASGEARHDRDADAQ